MEREAVKAVRCRLLFERPRRGRKAGSVNWRKFGGVNLTTGEEEENEEANSRV